MYFSQIFCLLVVSIAAVNTATISAENKTLTTNLELIGTENNFKLRRDIDDELSSRRVVNKKKSKKGSGSFKPQTLSGGKATFYNVGGDACETKSKNSDLVAAISEDLYGSFSKVSAYCKHYVTVTNTANKKSVKVKIVDGCPECSANDIDLSPTAFAKIGKKSKGVLKVTLAFEE